MPTVEPRRNMPEHFGIRIISAEKDKVVAELDADGGTLTIAVSSMAAPIWRSPTMSAAPRQDSTNQPI